MPSVLWGISPGIPRAGIGVQSTLSEKTSSSTLACGAIAAEGKAADCLSEEGGCRGVGACRVVGERFESPSSRLLKETPTPLSTECRELCGRELRGRELRRETHAQQPQTSPMDAASMAGAIICAW